MGDVNFKRSLIVKGYRVIDRLHDISYQTFKVEHSVSLGQ